MNPFRLILNADYALSVWFSANENKVRPGAAFLVLNKLAMVTAAVIFFIASKINLSSLVLVALTVLSSLLIMYGFQRRMEKKFNHKSVSDWYKCLSPKQIWLQRILALSLLVFSFVVMFVVGVVSFSG